MRRVMRRCRLAPSCGMTPVGFGAVGQFQLLGEIRAGRPQHQVATLAASPRRHPGQDLDPDRVDQDHPAQVEHDVMVARPIR